MVTRYMGYSKAKRRDPHARMWATLRMLAAVELSVAETPRGRGHADIALIRANELCGGVGHCREDYVRTVGELRRFVRRTITHIREARAERLTLESMRAAGETEPRSGEY